VSAVIATGVAKITWCQPDAASPLKVAVASFVPALLHKLLFAETNDCCQFMTFITAPGLTLNGL
jgi:hypothetical protein